MPDKQTANNEAEDAEKLSEDQKELYELYEAKSSRKTIGDNTYFDERPFYEERLKKQIKKIRQECQARGVPFYFTACIANTQKDGCVYVSEAIVPEANGIRLPENHFAQHVNVDLGFDTVLPREKYMKAAEGEIVEGIKLNREEGPSDPGQKDDANHE